MNIQFYPGLLDYVNAKLHPLATQSGSFVTLFLRACLAADSENFEVLKPTLEHFVQKYPAEPERLKMEREDRGATE